MAVRKPDTFQNLLLKPYFWQRPSQLLRRFRQVFSPPPDQAVVQLPALRA
jgi:hypothetical protein